MSVIVVYVVKIPLSPWPFSVCVVGEMKTGVKYKISPPIRVQCGDAGGNQGPSSSYDTKCSL